jgi:hypothetical protein
MSTNTCSRNAPAAPPTELDILRRVVVQHIVDGLRSGDPVAAAMARSLMTELDVAGLDVAAAVNALRNPAVTP